MVDRNELMTAEELLRMQPPHMRSELIDGRMIIREPGAIPHGRLAMAIGAALHAHVTERRLGAVVAAETGFILRRDPDTVRAPHVAFISKARLLRARGKGSTELTPDLVVEVLSPSDRAAAVRTKVADWLASGARLVWVVDGERRRADVYRADGTSHRIRAADALDGETVLPGFTLPLHTLLGE